MTVTIGQRSTTEAPAGARRRRHWRHPAHWQWQSGTAATWNAAGPVTRTGHHTIRLTCGLPESCGHGPHLPGHQAAAARACCCNATKQTRDVKKCWTSTFYVQRKVEILTWFESRNADAMQKTQIW